MNDREKWRERVRDSVLAARHDDDEDIYTHIYIWGGPCCLHLPIYIYIYITQLAFNIYIYIYIYT